jgi:branched-chain amino acid transport system ATP-binding protein
MSAFLDVSGLSAGYGVALAVRDATFSLERGKILSIVGPNGAGKTTLLLALSGLLKPTSGSVRLAGKDLTGLAAHKVAQSGMCLIPDDRGLFPDLTVGEHFRMAERSAVRRKRAAALSTDQALESFPRLAGLRDRRCGLLSGGEQQMLAVAKVLLLTPDVLMVDELSLGLAPVIVQELLPALQRIARDTGMTMLIVEQHYELALAIADDAIVLSHGQTVLQGCASSMLADRRALESAYLGGGDAEDR